MIELSPSDRSAIVKEIADAIAERLSTQPRLVDRYRLAESLGVSVPTIERLQRAGRIPIVRIGKRVLYDPEAVVAKLAQKKGGATDDQ